MSIIVTGASGFVGRHLLQHLRSNQDDHCYGLSRTSHDTTDIIECDLTDRKQVDSVLKRIKPRFIYHTAGSFSNIYETDFSNNVICAKNLLDSVAGLKIPAHILLMGSAAEYGEVAEEKNPVTEEQTLRPISIYGWTKAAQSQLAPVYFKTHNIEVIVARTFNLIGNGISDKLFVGRVKNQIAAVLAGNINRISVGSVDAIRDYLDISKACEMYRIIATKGSPGEAYNVASGQPVIMRDLLRRLLTESGLDYSIVDEMSYTKESTMKEVSVSYGCIDKYMSLISD